ncbi:GMP synthase subunit A [Caldiplasma sukawensis]
MIDLKIYVVDNGGQWTHKEWRLLTKLGVESEIVDNSMDFLQIKDADGWVLSGGAPSINTDVKELGNMGQLIDEQDRPILGICVGAQFTALHLGGKVRKAQTPEFGKTVITFTDKGGIFSNLPDAVTVWENHNDEIFELPEEMLRCAFSKNCTVQAFRSVKRPIFGVQFHPEVEHTMYGKDIFQNFIDYCR